MSAQPPSSSASPDAPRLKPASSRPTLTLTPPIYAHLCRTLLALGGAHHASLTALLRTNSTLYDIAAPYIYAEVALHKHNAEGVLRGLKLRELPERGPFGRGKVRTGAGGEGGVGLGGRKGVTEAEYRWPEESADSDSDSDSGSYADPGDASLKKRKLDKDALPAPGTASTKQSVNGYSDTNEDETETMYPNPASHARKLALVGMVRRLSLVSLPTTRLGMRFVSTFIRPASAHPTSGPISLPGTVFPLCTHLAISASCLWHMAEWSNRHRNLSHPFTRALLDVVSPTHLCVSHSRITPRLRDAWLDVRVDMRAGPPSDAVLADTRKRWWAFCHWYMHVALGNLVQMWGRLEEMDVHGVVDASVAPPAKGRVRVWYDACPCSVRGCDELEEAERRQRSVKRASGGAGEDTQGAYEEDEEETAEDGDVEDDDGDDSWEDESDDVPPSASECDQHVSLEGRGCDIVAMLGGPGSRLYTDGEAPQSVADVQEWVVVDAWRAALHVHEPGPADDMGWDGGAAGSGEAVGDGCGEPDHGAIQRYVSKTRDVVERDKAGLGLAVKDRVRWVRADEAGRCACCGGGRG